MTILWCVLVLCLLSRLQCEIHYSLAEAAATNAANLIYDRYEFGNHSHRQFFLGISNMKRFVDSYIHQPNLIIYFHNFIHSEAWELLKYKFLTKMTGSQPEFLMIFGGSSVTAGHDSWPLVFERRIKPVFDALGINLIVRNIAQGANQCLPYEYCYNAMGGDNADFIGWEQSFNW